MIIIHLLPEDSFKIGSVHVVSLLILRDERPPQEGSVGCRWMYRMVHIILVCRLVELNRMFKVGRSIWQQDR
jgi:hypothetical protein